jgi:transcriptional regulator with XRE-family HTH domain
VTCEAQRTARRRKNWSQVRTARELGVSQGYVALLERGLRQASPALQGRMAKVLDLPPTALSPSVAEHSVDADQLAEELASLGYPGFRHLRPLRQVVKNPAAVLLAALRLERLEPRAAEALPWLVATFPDLDWQWLVPRAKALDLQNRLGFVVTLARQLAERSNAASSPVLREREALLNRSRLVREDVFGRTTMTEAEKRWLRTTRPPEASHWNVLSSLTAEHLIDAG